MIREERNKWKIQSGVVSTANERLKYRTGKAGQSTDSEQGIIYYIFGFLFSLFWMVLIVHDSINIEVMISVLMIASFFIPALYTALGVIVFQAQLTTIRSFFFLALMMGIPLVALSIYVMVSSSSDSHSWFFLTFWGFLHILSSVFGAMIGLGVVNTLIALLF